MLAVVIGRDTVPGTQIALQWKIMHARIFGQHPLVLIDLFLKHRKLVGREWRVDLGRIRGGVNMIKTACTKLSENYYKLKKKKKIELNIYRNDDFFPEIV